MKDRQVEEIAQILLKERAKFWKAQEVEDYLKSYKINNSQLLAILELLIDEYIFRWLDFICQKLPDLTLEDDFVNLLKKIILKIKNDMAQGPFIRALIKIGEQNMKLGFSLYQQMILKGDSDLISYSSFPLGGAGKKSFNEALSLIKGDLNSQNPHLKAASIKALRVIFEDAAELQEPSEVFNILHTYSSEQEDTILQLEVLKAYFDFSRFEYEECIQQLLRFAKRENSEIRFALADILTYRDLRKKEDEIELLALCAEDSDKNVLSRVSPALSKKGHEFPEKSLRIIKNWIIKGRYFDIYEIDYCIREIGKVHIDRCITEVTSWIEEKDEDGSLKFFIPIVLSELSSQNYMQLIESVKTWLPRNEIFKRTALRTIKKVLTDIYPIDASKLDVADSCFQLLKEMANNKDVNIEWITRSESDKIFQCLRIIEELEREPKKLDFETMWNNLEKYPVIRDFIGTKWFKTMMEKKYNIHPLLNNLSSKIDETKLQKKVEAARNETDNLKRFMIVQHIRSMLMPIAFLEYLDAMLRVIISKSAKLKSLKSGLKNEKQFWETISEIEVLSSFMSEYDVEIAPELNGKKLDLKVKFNGEVTYIEVISPNMFKPLRFLSGKAIGLKNRVRGKVLDEFKAHFKDLTDIGNIPFVIVIDIGRSEISYDFVEDCLMGTEQLTFLIDKENGKVVGEYPTRAADSIHDLKKGTEILSAIVCYKTVFLDDLGYHRECKIIPNIHAKNPLNQVTINKIILSLGR